MPGGCALSAHRARKLIVKTDGQTETEKDMYTTSNQPRQSTQIQDRRRCLRRVREWSDTISYMKRCIRTDCQVKDRDLRLNSKIK
jgi:hypothetical protein